MIDSSKRRFALLPEIVFLAFQKQNSTLKVNCEKSKRMGDTFFVENTQHRNGIYVKCSHKQGCILFECTVHAVKLVNLVFFSLKMGRVRENIMGHSFTSREVSNVIEVFFNECCLANDIVTKRLFFIMSCFREMGLTVCGQSEPENQSKICPLPPKEYICVTYKFKWYSSSRSFF